MEGKCFHPRPGRLPTRPLADLDAGRLNRQYQKIDVDVDRRDCVVCSKVVSVEKLSRNLRNNTNISMPSMLGELKLSQILRSSFSDS